MKNLFLIDLPVALIFFNRPKPLGVVFEAIREAKPSKLFLIQDGARQEKSSDIEKIEECRKIVSIIDWECEVFRNYEEENLGCGMRIYSGISWCFTFVDRLCVLEDDCVPAPDFFPFMKELLEKYRNDNRIDMISGMNNLETFERNQYSYFFAETGSIWGWATWKRVWDKIDYNIDFINDSNVVRLLKNSIKPKRLAKQLIKSGKRKHNLLKNGKKLSSWSYQRGMNMYLNSGLIIVPVKNLVSNIGLTDDSVHAVNSLSKIPKAIQRLFLMKTYEIEFPLKHPNYIIKDNEFDSKMNKLMHPNIVVKFFRKLESLIRRMIF